MHKVPQYAKVTYFCIVSSICPQKKETHRVQLTLVGDKITFYGPVSTPTSDIKTSKIHWNSIILTLLSKYLVVDVKHIYLNNIMAKHEYYKIAISLIHK